MYFVYNSEATEFLLLVFFDDLELVWLPSPAATAGGTLLDFSGFNGKALESSIS